MERIGVWWDMESCPLPTYMNPHVIMSLSTALLANFKIQGNVHHFSAFESFPKQSNEFKQILAHSGIRLQQIPPDKSNEIEKTILVDVLFWAMDTPAPAHIIFIVGNLDFSNVFHRLRQRRYNVFLLCSSARAISPGMRTASSACLEWQSLGLRPENGAINPLSQRSPTIQNWPCEYDPPDFASAVPNTLASANPVPNSFSSANSIQTGWNREELRGFENISSLNMTDNSGIVDNTNAIPGIPAPSFHHHPWGFEQPNSHSPKPKSSETRSKHKEKASNKKKREPKPPKHDLPDFTPAMPNAYSSASSVPPNWNSEELRGLENISGFTRAENRNAKTENQAPSFHDHPDFTPAMPNPYSSASSVPPNWNREELRSFENIYGTSRVENRKAKTENPAPSFHNLPDFTPTMPNSYSAASCIPPNWDREELRGFENISVFSRAENRNSKTENSGPSFHDIPDFTPAMPNPYSSASSIPPNWDREELRGFENISVFSRAENRNSKTENSGPSFHDIPDFTPAMPNPYSSASSIPPDWNREELRGFENISGSSRTENRNAKTENPVPSFHNHIRSTDHPSSHGQKPKYSEPRCKPQENPAFGKKKRERRHPISENKKQEPKPSISEKKNQGPETPKTPPNPKAIKSHFKAWLRQVVNSEEHKNGYNISTIYQDFKRATGKTLDLNSLGIENLSTLLLEFKDVALMTEVSNGCLELFPVKSVEQKPSGASVSGDKSKASTDDIRNWLLQLLQKGELSQGILMSSLRQNFEGQTGMIIDLDYLGYKKVTKLITEKFSDIVSVNKIGTPRMFPADLPEDTVSSNKNGKETLKNFTTKETAATVHPANVPEEQSKAKAPSPYEGPPIGWDENIVEYFQSGSVLTNQDQALQDEPANVWYSTSFPTEASDPVISQESSSNLMSDSSNTPRVSEISELEAQTPHTVSEISFHSDSHRAQVTDLIQQLLLTLQREQNSVPTGDSATYAERLVAEAVQSLGLVRDNNGIYSASPSITEVGETHSETMNVIKQSGSVSSAKELKDSVFSLLNVSASPSEARVDGGNDSGYAGNPEGKENEQIANSQGDGQKSLNSVASPVGTIFGVAERGWKSLFELTAGKKNH
eukprot:Gb_39279 [translate_table: standard]